VTRVQAIPTSRAALVFEHAHHQADRGRDRGPAADLGDPGAGDSEAVGDGRLLAAEDHVGAGGEPDAEVEADEAEDVDADHEDRDRAGRLVFGPEVETRPEEDDRQQGRRDAAVEGEADQRGMIFQQRPAFLGQAPTAFDPAHRSSLEFASPVKAFRPAPALV
jgi:hypothetical protein